MEAGNTKHLAWKPVLIRFIAQLFSSKAVRIVHSSEMHPSIWESLYTNPPFELHPALNQSHTRERNNAITCGKYKALIY